MHIFKITKETKISILIYKCQPPKNMKICYFIDK